MKKRIDLTKLKARWQQLSLREQRMLMIAVPVVCLALVYVAIIQPYLDSRASLDAQIPALSETLQKMKNQAALVKELQEANRVVSISPDKLKEAVEDSLRRASLDSYVTKVEDVGNGRVQLVAAQMPFKKWIFWLERLSKEIGIAVTVIKIRSAGEGVVSIDATLAPLGAEQQSQSDA